MATARNYAIVHRSFSKLAQRYGIVGNGILSQIDHIGDGRYVPLTLAQLAAHFPGLTRQTVGTHVQELVLDGALERRETSPQKFSYRVNHRWIRHKTGVVMGETPPQVYNPYIAAAIGMQEALLLADIMYWQKRCDSGTINGERAVYLALSSEQRDSWASHFPYISLSEIQRALNKLASLDLIYIGRPATAHIHDRTMWYATNPAGIADLLSWIGADGYEVRNWEIVKADRINPDNPFAHTSPEGAARFANRLAHARANGFRRPSTWEVVAGMDERYAVDPALRMLRKVKGITRADIARVLLALSMYAYQTVYSAIQAAIAAPTTRVWRKIMALLNGKPRIPRWQAGKNIRMACVATRAAIASHT